MTLLMSLAVPGNLGNIVGPNADGVLAGKLTAKDPTKVLLKSRAVAGLCITDDGGSFVDETTPFGESTADDVEVLPATPAVDDAVYFGHATKKFGRVDLNITTQGDGTWTLAWEYWNGEEYAALENVTDGTTAFEAATGWASVTFDIPADWAKNTVDGVNAYWIRARVATYDAVTTAPQVGQGWIITQEGEAGWTDDKTDFTDSGASDCAALPAYPIVGDGLYIGYSQPFCKVKVTVGQARTGTATITWKYWNGSAWTAITAATIDDDSVGFSAGTSTYLVHFVPPADWVANTAANGPNGQAGYFVVAELAAITSVTAQPLITQGWVYPLNTDAMGIRCPARGTVTRVDLQAQTKSGANADSKFLLVNRSQNTCVSFTWTKAEPCDFAAISLPVSEGDELVLVQVTEDGTTEFADAMFLLAM